MSSPLHLNPGSTPLRVLCVLANPTDLAKFDSERIWRELTQAVSGVPSVVCERLADSTEIALRRACKESSWDVVHFIGHGQERSAAHYGTLALQAADKRARNLTAPYLREWLSGFSSIQLVVLQGCDHNCRFDTIAESIADKGITAVTLPALDGSLVNAAVSKLYAAVAEGSNANHLAQELQTLSATRPGVARVVSRQPEQPIWEAGSANASVSAAPVVTPPVISPKAESQPARVSTAAQEPPHAAPQPNHWAAVLDEKRKQGHFDVFLCHNSIDKPTVKQIAHRLKENGILPWLDVWELPPGQPWQPLLETQIEAIHAAAVFVGAAGVAPWQENEMRGFLEEFRNRDMPVIPVLLPGSPAAPRLPLFLRQMTWVDFRSQDPDPLQLLIWGITGERPKD